MFCCCQILSLNIFNELRQTSLSSECFTWMHQVLLRCTQLQLKKNEEKVGLCNLLTNKIKAHKDTLYHTYNMKNAFCFIKSSEKLEI